VYPKAVLNILCQAIDKNGLKGRFIEDISRRGGDLAKSERKRAFVLILSLACPQRHMIRFREFVVTGVRFQKIFHHVGVKWFAGQDLLEVTLIYFICSPFQEIRHEPCGFTFPNLVMISRLLEGALVLEPACEAGGSETVCESKGN
jgi:hypothetical protein